MQEFYLGILAGGVVFGSAGVLGMGMWCSASLMKEIAKRRAVVDDLEEAIDQRDKALTDYATERRKRLEAEQAHTDLADKYNCTLDRIENVFTLIDSIPHRKGKETRIKAMLRGEA